MQYLNIINHCSSGIEAALSNAEQALNKWLESIWFPYVEEASSDSTKGGSSTSTGRFLKQLQHPTGLVDTVLVETTVLVEEKPLTFY